MGRYYKLGYGTISAGGHKLMPAKAGSIKLQYFAGKMLEIAPIFADKNIRYRR